MNLEIKFRETSEELDEYIFGSPNSWAVTEIDLDIANAQKGN